MNDKKYYAVPYISNSTLTWFKVSPKYCWKRMNLEIVDEEKSYTYLGKQIHLSLLEPEEFEKTYTYLDFKAPTSKQQIGFCESYVREKSLIKAYEDNYISEKVTDAAKLKAAERIYETCSEYIKYLEIRGDYREVLSKSKQELLTTITNSIKSHKKANCLMFSDSLAELKLIETFNELPVFWEYPIYWQGSGLKCKSLIDRLVVDHTNKKVTIVDLKTTSILGDFSDDIANRNYYRQLAFYRLAIQHSKLFPKDYEIEAYIVAVNTQDPYECRVYKLSDAEYQKQTLIINKLLTDISWHWFTNQWDYSRTYYEGDGTENLIDDYSNQSIERNQTHNLNEILIADVGIDR
jgi:hypothetical protein